MQKYIPITILCSLSIASLNACTGTFLKSAENGFVYARTLEFGQDLQSQILFIPRNFSFITPSPHTSKNGLTWQSKYAALGANSFGLIGFVDGVNEKGLAGGLFYFPGFTEYQNVTPAMYDRSIPMWQLLTWVLTNFASIAETKAALPSIYISNAPVITTTHVPPAHLVIHDSAGASIVIECVKGSVIIHDNPLGVITNAPTFDWHMTNLRNYINLTALNAPDKTMAGITFSPLGQGSGMIGLPGDFTPPSRLVRITAFSQSAPQLKTQLDTVLHTFHMLNNFDIPKGSVVDAQGTTESTQWTSSIDLKNKIFYFKTYDNFQLQKADLMKMDLNAKKHTTFTMQQANIINSVN